MSLPAFSVSMCVCGKDNPEWFSLAMESILQQTAPPAEIVLVVDGPVPPELEKVICRYAQHSALRVIRFAENQGHGKARRAGLEACRHELVALMDADDLCVPTRFEQQLQLHSAHVVDAVGGDITEFIGEPGNIVARRCVPQTDEAIKQCMKQRCGLNQVTVMFRKGAVEAAGGYIDWYCNEDYYLWARMLLNGARMMNTGTVLVNVRVGEDMYRRRGGWRYFLSEAKLQGYMLRHGLIDPASWLFNILKRLIVQVLLPNRMRGWVFQKFARKKA